jgi:short subunit dehydrogenase-like uncharacterized protein
MTDVATVFGGSGFIGRYVVRRLARAGKTVRVAVRNTERALFLKTAGSIGQIVPLYAPVTDAADVHRAVEGADWVVNPGDPCRCRRPCGEDGGRCGSAASGPHLSDWRRPGQ